MAYKIAYKFNFRIEIIKTKLDRIERIERGDGGGDSLGKREMGISKKVEE